MSAKRIIPCLDVRGGKVVKGVNFEGVKEVGDPVEFAEKYNRQGADEIVLYDISASIENRIVDLDLVRRIKAVINVPFAVAGGISTVEDFRKVLEAGADKVSINSMAIKNPTLIKQAADMFGSGCIILGVDAKRDNSKSSGFAVMVSGGMKDSGLDLIEWVRTAEELGVGEICLNSIDTDGVKQGYDIDMLNAVCAAVGVPVIASGGCGKVEHFSEVFEKTKASAALAASVFHFGELTVEEIKKFLTESD
ncbi:MAG: imidazole glycerol phosphate synthase subunit HisF [Oscillospiraceae bacterium]|nr:imidazole glycerol phosphate synthase subunit HisF [Oscillospiraceae bacterium]